MKLQKNLTLKNSKQILATVSISIEKLKFVNGQQGIIQYQTSRARQLSLVDESINSLKLSTLLGQVKYILILIVNFKKHPD